MNIHDIDRRYREISLKLNAIARAVTPSASFPARLTERDPMFDAAMDARARLIDEQIELRRLRARLVEGSHETVRGMEGGASRPTTAAE